MTNKPLEIHKCACEGNPPPQPHQRQTRPYRDQWRIECDCGRSGPWCLLTDQAVRAWNDDRRTATEIERLRNALKPFAGAAGIWKDGGELVLQHAEPGGCYDLKTDDFNRVIAALTSEDA
jgi:hypothetical protein